MNLKRRKASNYFANATLSKRYHYRLVFASLLFLTMVMLYLTGLMREITLQVSFIAANDPVAAESIYNSLNHFFIIACLAFFIYFLFSVLFVVVLEEKVGGPTVAILKFIEELKKENFEYQRNLRTGDELDSIMNSLKELQEQLKAKASKK